MRRKDIKDGQGDIALEELMCPVDCGAELHSWTFLPALGMPQPNVSFGLLISIHCPLARELQREFPLRSICK
jgi:hypothetical protein